MCREKDIRLFERRYYYYAIYKVRVGVVWECSMLFLEIAYSLSLSLRAKECECLLIELLFIFFPLTTEMILRISARPFLGAQRVRTLCKNDHNGQQLFIFDIY